MLHIAYPYDVELNQLPDEISLGDHLNGFDQDFNNEILARINQVALDRGRPIVIYHHSALNFCVQQKYPMLKFKTRLDTLSRNLFVGLSSYNIHPSVHHLSFVCSFNGTPHVGRKLLVAALKLWRYFDPNTCSKNFRFSIDHLDGHLGDYLDEVKHRFYRPFFIANDSEKFFDSIYSFGHVQYQHEQNIYNLENQLTSSFLHVVSETLATSYYPFVTEKFLYSVVTRGLFLAYAQPGWHDHLERYYGFRKYARIFDYRFDLIHNPVERLVELMSMISKFSVLSSDDWQDLYEMEIDTIEYNYDHYFSGNYIKQLESLC